MKRWLWFLTHEVRVPYVMVTASRIYAAPRHITDPRLKGLPLEVEFIPTIPAYHTVRRWIWER